MSIILDTTTDSLPRRRRTSQAARVHYLDHLGDALRQHDIVVARRYRTWDCTLQLHLDDRHPQSTIVQGMVLRWHGDECEACPDTCHRCRSECGWRLGIDLGHGSRSNYAAQLDLPCRHEPAVLADAVATTLAHAVRRDEGRAT